MMTTGLIEVSKFTILDDEQSREFLRPNHPFRVKGIFIAFIEGEVTVKINKQEQSGNDLILLTWTYTSIEILKLPLDKKLRVIYFQEDLILEKRFFLDYQFIFAMYKYPYCFVEKEIMDDLIKYGNFFLELQNIRDEKDQTDMNRQMLYALFLKLKSIYIEKKIIHDGLLEDADNSISDKFNILLYQHCPEAITPSFYADKLGVDVEELSAIIKDEWGATVEDWMTTLSVNYLKIDLREPLISLEDILRRFRFSDIDELNTYLQQHTGNDISAYRSNR